MRRATKCEGGTVIDCHISIHALHEESDYRDTLTVLGYVQISIHALHEESDQAWSVLKLLPMAISIHALHEESDPTVQRHGRSAAHFNPRSP